MTQRYRYSPVKGTANNLFTRMAFDDIDGVTENAQHILDFLCDKISDEDLHQVEESLKMEAGVKTDSEEKADAMIAGAKARGSTAQDAKRRQLALDASAAASDARQADFAARFPSATRIGHI